MNNRVNVGFSFDGPAGVSCHYKAYGSEINDVPTGFFYLTSKEPGTGKGSAKERVMQCYNFGESIKGTDHRMHTVYVVEIRKKYAMIKFVRPQ